MEKHKIKSYIKQIRGVSYKPDDLCDVLDNSSVILLRANNIEDGIINFDNIQYVSKSKVSSEQYLKKGDILICASSGSKNLVGKAASFDFDIECTFGAFCKVIRPKDGYSQYLSVFFQSQSYRQKISEFAIGANINNIRNEHIDELYISMYPESERCFIVKKVNAVHSIIYWRKYMIKKLDELIKARFVEMFGDVKANPYGFEKMALKDTCTVITGNTPSRSVPEYYGDSIEWIKTDNIVSGQLRPSQALEYLSDEGIKVGRTVEKGAILMACIAGSVASIGRVCITDRKVAFNQQINAIVSEDYDSLFLHTMLQLSKEYLAEEINMALKGILSKSKLEGKEFIVPPIEQQKQFANFVAQVNKSKFEVQKALDKAQLLFDSLMQKYFE